MTGMGDSETPSAPAATVSRTPVWVRVLLVASLAVNLLVAGIVVGARVGHGRDEGVRLPRDAGALLYLGALPREDRAALVAELRAESPGGPDRRERMAEALAEVRATLATLRAEPFEADAFARRLGHQRAVAARRGERAEALLVERVAAMSPDERRAYADALEETLRRMSRRARD
jgi:uncharacterized membrane protein